MRRLPPLLALPVLTLAAPCAARADGSQEAEWVRIALARGPSLLVQGRDLVATAPGAAPVPLGPRAELTAAGPFVTDGTTLAPRLAVADRAGAGVRVAGMGVLGSLEILAGNGGLVAIDTLDMEYYVAAVVGAEMPASWPSAALEAQAIAARTYALRRKTSAPDAPFHLEASVRNQAYRGADSFDPRAVAAAHATRGLVVAAGHELAEAYFFSSCRGTTESGTAALGRDAPYLQPVSCAGGEDAPAASWTRSVPLAELSRRLRATGAIGDALTGVEIASRTATGRAASIRLTVRGGARTMSGAEFRRAVGWSELPSLDFDVRVADRVVVLTGSGAGHGVGLCQWCARGLAARGTGRDAILAHFYPGTALVRMY